MQQRVPAGMPYTPQQGALSAGATTPHRPRCAEPSKRSPGPRKPHINQNAADQSHPLPSSHARDQAGLQHHPGGDGAGWGDISCPLPPARLQIQVCALCARKGWRASSTKTCFWGKEPLAPTPALGQLRIPRTHVPRGALGRLGLPGSGRAAVEPAPSPSIILISPAGSRPGPGSGAARRETGRRQRGDKPRHKQKQLAWPETSKRRAEIYVAAEPARVLGRWGQPPGRNVGRMHCCGSCVQSHGSDKLCRCNWDAGKG